MARPRTIEVKKHISGDELERRISEESDPRLKERLVFVRILYDGDKVEAVANKVERIKPTGYDWLRPI